MLGSFVSGFSKGNLEKLVKKYDFIFILLGLLIFLVGILNLYSATYASSDLSLVGLYKSQLSFGLISIVVCIFLSLIDSRTYFRYSYFFYLIVLFVLVLVLLLGRIGMGAQRWIHLGPIGFQPSEFAKVIIVLALARWFSTHGAERQLFLRDLIVPALITLVPAVLIIVQPDLGTGILICLLLATICFYRNLSWKTITIVSVITLFGAIATHTFVLKDYQKKRITTFLNPSLDARGAGYNAIQSRIAIGSGQFTGKGFLKSTQAALNYLPENHTDFVFSIYNEEHGFLGALFLVILYAALFYRFIWLSTVMTKVYNSFVIIGLFAIFFWHTIINMGMVTGLLPIVGIPLPLLSYGGSSLLTFWIIIGLATSMSNSRKLF